MSVEICIRGNPHPTRPFTYVIIDRKKVWPADNCQILEDDVILNGKWDSEYILEVWLQIYCQTCEFRRLSGPHEFKNIRLINVPEDEVDCKTVQIPVQCQACERAEDILHSNYEAAHTSDGEDISEDRVGPNQFAVARAYNDDPRWAFEIERRVPGAAANGLIDTGSCSAARHMFRCFQSFNLDSHPSYREYASNYGVHELPPSDDQPQPELSDEEN